MLHRRLLFHGFEQTGWLLACVAAVGVALALMVVLFRYERRLVPRRIGTLLLGLRVAVLGVILLTLMQPVLSWTLTRNRTGRIVVAVDLSESMTTSDRHADQAEKLRWARALGMIGNAATKDRLDQWIAAYTEGKEPEWVDPRETADAEQRERLAQSRRENIEAVFEEIDRLPRKDIAERLLQGTSAPLLDRLKKLGEVETVVFAANRETVEPDALEKTIAEPPSDLLSETSDLTKALAVPTGTDDDKTLLGIVLFSDGRDTTTRNPVEAAAALRSLSVPVYPVVLGSHLRPRDIAIATLDYPQTAFKDDHPRLKATLNTSQFEGQPITVELKRQGDQHADEPPQTKTVTPEGSVTTVEFDLDAIELGRQEYLIRTDVLPGETRDDNNSRTFALTVVDDRVHVLIVEGEPRWEFRYLDNALKRDERVEVTSVVFNQPYMGVLDDTFFPRQLALPAKPDDLANSPFAEPDVVILGDVAPSELSPAAWELLRKFVAESGGTLVLQAGKQHLPLAYRSTVLDELLPIRNPRPFWVTDSPDESPLERGFHLRLTPEGEAEEMLQFAADRQQNRAVWSNLPGHAWAVLGEAKPGATVFAEAVLPGEGLEGERRNAVIAHQYFGFGQVLWIGIDSTWRWRHRIGDRYHHRFWGQLGRWAASNKATAGNEFVKFGPERSEIDLGEEVVIRARWTQPFLRQHPNLKARAELFRISDKKPKPYATLDLSPVEARPLAHEARAASLPGGEYRVKLVVENADLGPEEIAASLIIHDKPSLELSDLSANPDLLNQIAEASGGRLFQPDELDKLPDAFTGFESSSSTYQEIDLWDHWLVLTVLCGLMMSEWVLRKLNGLP